MVDVHRSRAKHCSALADQVTRPRGGGAAEKGSLPRLDHERSGHSALADRLVERLVEVASPAEDQIELFGDDGWYEELALGYVDWSILAFGELERQGALSPEARRSAEAVSQALLSLLEESGLEVQSSGNAVAFTEDGLRHDPRWATIRATANDALAAFDGMGS